MQPVANHFEQINGLKDRKLLAIPGNLRKRSMFGKVIRTGIYARMAENCLGTEMFARLKFYRFKQGSNFRGAEVASTNKHKRTKCTHAKCTQEFRFTPPPQGSNFSGAKA